MAYTYKTKKLTIPAGETSAQVQLEQGAIGEASTLFVVPEDMFEEYLKLF